MYISRKVQDATESESITTESRIVCVESAAQYTTYILHTYKSSLTVGGVFVHSSSGNSKLFGLLRNTLGVHVELRHYYDSLNLARKIACI